MRRRIAWSLVTTATAAASSPAIAHDGGVLSILTICVAGGLFLGGVGGTLSGWFNRRWAACLGGALALCGAVVVGLELATDRAIATNFWSNIGFLTPVAGIPLVLSYWVTHFIGVNLRRAKRTDQEAPNSTVESDARKNSARGSL